MAAINELISQIQDVNLRDRILQEVSKLQKQKKFGLVYEEHIPEATPLYDVPIRKGTKVVLRDGNINECYRVQDIMEENASCVRLDDSKEQVILKVRDLVPIAHFGEPIYPYLKYVDSVSNAPDSDLWHTLIQADNYHALQLLVYLYGGKVDCIYIDPPYNTGAKDWKYNNDYVDNSDSYRHSKWLSMMEKRLKLAKKLLNPQDSVLIVTIDEKEYLHLGCLLEQMFPESRIQMISSVINPKGTMQRKVFPRTDEYIYYIWNGDAEPLDQKLSNDWLIGNAENTKHNRYRWQPYVRGNIMRTKTPTMFYPIYVDTTGKKILRVGESMPLSQKREDIIPQENERVIFPLNTKKEEAIWHLTQDSLLEAYKKGYVRLSGFNKQGEISVSYLSSGMQKKIEDGVIPIIGRDESGAVIFSVDEYMPEFIPGTQWRIKTHDATEHGSKLLQNFIGKRFSYPKSLYAVEDTIRFYVSNKPNALIVDFFAGSGTTLHAVNLLNAEDGGHRRCIMVTNNEVSVEEAKDLKAKGYRPGDEEWEQLGIAQYVNWPRTTCSILGKDINGSPLKGNYIGSDIPMSDGFKTNAIYFKLGFLDKTSVSLGQQLQELMSVLWMKAGAKGQCPLINGEDYVPSMMVLPRNEFALLNDEKVFSNFVQQIAENESIKMVYLVVNSDAMYREMAKVLSSGTFASRNIQTCQLYRDYLDNFRINTPR